MTRPDRVDLWKARSDLSFMEVDPDQIPNLTLRRIEGMRKENDALRDQVVRLFDQQERLLKSLNGFWEMARSEFGSIRSDLNTVKSDILHLENQNMSRHGEVLALMRRTEDLST